ncbi:MAG: hypothetical protein R2941_18840 [Desulfobacterales bacterium]
MAEMTLKYSKGSARRAETVFGWSRIEAEISPGEKCTGIIRIGAQTAGSGRTAWEKREPDAADALRRQMSIPSRIGVPNCRRVYPSDTNSLLKPYVAEGKADSPQILHSVRFL